jgi:hypothetical protein
MIHAYLHRLHHPLAAAQPRSRSSSDEVAPTLFDNDEPPQAAIRVQATSPTPWQVVVHPDGGNGSLAGTGALDADGGSVLGLACARQLTADGAVVTICGTAERQLNENADAYGRVTRSPMSPKRNRPTWPGRCAWPRHETPSTTTSTAAWRGPTTPGLAAAVAQVTKGRGATAPTDGGGRRGDRPAAGLEPRPHLRGGAAMRGGTPGSR